MVASLKEFAVLLKRAEASMLMGGGFPQRFVSILCMKNAALTENDKSLVLASIQGALAFAAARNRCVDFSGSRAGAARQDVLDAGDFVAPPGEGNGRAAWFSYRSAGQKQDFVRKADGDAENAKIKVNVMVRSLTVLTDARGNAIGALRVTVSTILRRAAHRWTAVEEGLRSPRLRG